MRRFLICLALGWMTLAATARATNLYSGRATGIKADVLGVTNVVSDTGDLPATGGSKSTTLASANVPGLVTAGVLSAATSASGPSSQSNASVADLDLAVLGNTISAEILKSNASAVCGLSGPSVGGSSQVLNLVINGQAITVSGDPNQTINLPLGLGTIIINEQKSSVNGNFGQITVNALHVIVTSAGGVADVVVSSSHADIQCGVSTTCSPNRAYSGQATVVAARALGPGGVNALLSDTGPLPSSGGSLDSSLANTNIPGLLTATALSATTSGSGDQSQSSATLAAANLTVAGLTITADVLESNASAGCPAGVSGNSTVLNLKINNQGVSVSGSPNQTVALPLGLGSLIINEQSSTVSGGYAEITVTALHVIVTNILDIYFSRSHADIWCTVPTVTYSGQARVFSSTIANVTTNLADTGPLPLTGGTAQSTLLSANVPGLVSANLLSAQTNGSGGTSQSSASAADVNVTLPGPHTVTAQVLQSTATAACPTPTTSGSSVVLGLTVDGLAVNVSGNPNQVVDLPGIHIVINEQASTGPGDITVSALHVTVAGGLADTVFSTSHADVTCGAKAACPPPPAGCPTCASPTQSNPYVITNCGGGDVVVSSSITLINLPTKNVVLKCALQQLAGTDGIKINVHSLKVDGPGGGSITSVGTSGIQITAGSGSGSTCDTAATIDLESTSLRDNNSNGGLKMAACGNVIINSSTVNSKGDNLDISSSKGKICASGSALGGNRVTLTANGPSASGAGDIVLTGTSIQTVGPRDLIKLTSNNGSILAGSHDDCPPNSFGGGNESNFTADAHQLADFSGACIRIAENITIKASGSGHTCAAEVIIDLTNAVVRDDFGKTGVITITACGGSGNVDINDAILVDSGQLSGSSDPNAVATINGGKKTDPSAPLCSESPGCGGPVSQPVSADRADRLLHHAIGIPRCDT